MRSQSCNLWRSFAGVFICLLAAILSATPAMGQGQFRAVWADAFHSGYKSTAQIDQLISHLVAARYNVIIPEILAYHDNVGGGHGAYWNSSIVPKAADIVGDIDPLAYLIQQAHANGIEVHGWLVAFRSCSSWPPSGNPTVAAHPEWIMVPQANTGNGLVSISSAYQFDPGSPDVQDYLMSIVQEVVTNYEIDGIHWDYIRYTQADAGYPSDLNYTKSGLIRFWQQTGRGDIPPASGDTQWNDFRRRTIDEVVRRCRVEMAAITTNPRQPLRHTAALVTWGNVGTDFTATSAWGLFSNWEFWMRDAYLDGSVPMCYDREHLTDQALWYRNWVDATISWRYARHAYPGQANYLNTMANSVTQLQYSYNNGADGTSNYSYYATSDNDLNGWENDWTWYTNYVPTNMFTSSASIPSMPWRNPATATEGTVWGRITDLASGDPVDNASVQVGSQDVIYTDGAGYYVRTLVPATAGGTNYDITVNKTGYAQKVYPAATVVAGDQRRYDIGLGDPPGPPATIEVIPMSVDRLMVQGDNLPNDTFTVRTTVVDSVLNYSITDNATWLSVDPPNGNSTGEADTIDIIYNTTGLAVGSHTANINVADPEATNSPQTLVVNVTVVSAVPPDFDGDGDVDGTDLTHFVDCTTGPNAGPPIGGCEDADLDMDSDVDQIDFGYMQRCLSGTGVAPDAACGGDCQSAGDCDDGLFCNGTEYCSGGFCRSSTEPCAGETCDEDLDFCIECYVDGDCDDGVGCTSDSCNAGTCSSVPNNAVCDDGLFCNGAETCDPTLDCQAGSDPCNGHSCDEENDVCDVSELWMSFTATATVPGVGTVENEDIVAYNESTGAYTLIFDGSDVGLSGLTINAMAVLPTGEILLSFTASGDIPGMTGGPAGITADDSDIVMFTPTSLGADTAGSFSFYFDGSDVGLSNSSEDIDALAIAADGRLVISTSGAFSGNGASGDDEDMFTFSDTSLGESTAGTFEMTLDGSDVGLADTADEDIDAAGFTSTGTLLFSTLGVFSVTGASGDDEDVAEFTASQWGDTTSGSYSLFLDLSTTGMDAGVDVGSLELIE